MHATHGGRPTYYRMIADCRGGAPDSCWMWPGNTDRDGYGVIKHEKRMKRAHRLSYEMHVGPIPDGMVIDHRCNTPGCWNPQHLDAVSNQENLQKRRAISKSNKSGYRGVYASNTPGKWRAMVKFNGKTYHLGTHDTPEAAHAVAEAKRREFDFYVSPS